MAVIKDNGSLIIESLLKYYNDNSLMGNTDLIVLSELVITNNPQGGSYSVNATWLINDLKVPQAVDIDPLNTSWG